MRRFSTPTFQVWVSHSYILFFQHRKLASYPRIMTLFDCKHVHAFCFLKLTWNTSNIYYFESMIGKTLYMQCIRWKPVWAIIVLKENDNRTRSEILKKYFFWRLCNILTLKRTTQHQLCIIYRYLNLILNVQTLGFTV